MVDIVRAFYSFEHSKNKRSAQDKNPFKNEQNDIKIDECMEIRQSGGDKAYNRPMNLWRKNKKREKITARIL